MKLHSRNRKRKADQISGHENAPFSVSVGEESYSQQSKRLR